MILEKNPEGTLYANALAYHDLIYSSGSPVIAGEIPLYLSPRTPVAEGQERNETKSMAIRLVYHLSPIVGWGSLKQSFSRQLTESCSMSGKEVSASDLGTAISGIVSSGRPSRDRSVPVGSRYFAVVRITSGNC